MEAYGDNGPTKSICRQWFRRFKNHDFNVEDKEHEGAPIRFEYKDFVAILDGDTWQTEMHLATSLNVTQQYISQLLR